MFVLLLYNVLDILHFNTAICHIIVCIVISHLFYFLNSVISTILLLFL